MNIMNMAVNSQQNMKLLYDHILGDRGAIGTKKSHATVLLTSIMDP